MLSVQDGSKNFNKILWLIAGVALFFRAWGVWFGLPLLFNPDEPIFVNTAMHMGSAKTLNPHWFGNPGNILIYLLFFEFAVYYLFGHSSGMFANAEAFRDAFFVDPTVPYLLGRAIGVISGTLGVVALGHLGKRLVNERVGLVAAILFALDPLAVEHAKYIRVDILGTLFILLAVYYGLKFWDERRRRDIIFASIAAGLAVAAKYPFAIIGIVVVLIAIFMWRESPAPRVASSGWWNRPGPLFGASCVIMFLSYFCVTPFFFFDFGKAWHDIAWEARSNHLGHESLPVFQNYWWYISSVLSENAGMLVALAAGLGLLLGLRRLDWRQILVMAFPIIFFIFIGTGRLRWSRWVIPVLPFISLYAAVALNLLFERISSAGFWQRQKHRVAILLPQLIFVAIVGIFISYSFGISVAQNRRLCLPDTRQICTQWIKENIPEGKFAQDFYTFQPFPRYSYWQGEFAFENYAIFQSFSIAGKTLEDYRAAGFTHLLVSSWIYNRYLEDANRYPQEEQFYRTLISQTPLRAFESTNAITGPRIAIYALN